MNEALEFIQNLEINSKIIFRYTIILVPDDGSDPFSRGSVFKKGKIIDKTNNSFTVKVKYSAEDNNGIPEWKKVNQTITIKAENLLQQFEHLPPKVIIILIKPPPSEGGRRKTRKHKKSKKQSKKQTRRYK